LSKDEREQVILLMCGDCSRQEVAAKVRVVQHIKRELPLHAVTSHHKQFSPFSWTDKMFARLYRRE
jgi:hypothetical protein